MIISYYIPEDGDAIDHPNFFVYEANSLTLGQLKKIFPVPGEYHFRFRKTIGSTTVWMDATNDTNPVPLDSSGNIFSKVSRISLGPLSQIPNQSSQQQKVPVSAPPPPVPELLLTTSPKASTPKSSTAPVEQKTRERRNSDKLLSFDNFDEPSPGVQPVASAFNNDFLDFSAPAANSTTVPQKNDPFGFVDITSTPLTAAPVHRSHSGNSIPSMPLASANGSNSPMGMGRGGPMSGGMGGAPMAPMGARGNNSMGFDAFSNMTPSQQQASYRSQQQQAGRR